MIATAEKRLIIEPTITCRGLSPGPLPRRHKVYKVTPRIIIPLLFLALSNLVIQSLLIQQDHQAQRWQALIHQQQRELIKSRVEMADLGSLDRIQRLAQNQLGMRMAGINDHQLIAAVPLTTVPRSNYLARIQARPSLWSQVTSWFSGYGATLAQAP